MACTSFCDMPGRMLLTFSLFDAVNKELHPQVSMHSAPINNPLLNVCFISSVFIFISAKLIKTMLLSQG